MDNKIETEPILLDGSVTPRGQGQEGNELNLADYSNFLKERNRFYVAKKGHELTFEDYDILWQAESERSLELMRRDSKRKYIEFMDSYLLVLDKVDQEASMRLMDAYLYSVKQAKKNNHAGHELGAREFTFTYSPKWCSDEEARDLMRKAIQKIIKYYTDEIVQLRAVGEVGSNGLSHVHCFYKLRGGLKITDKNFKRAYKYWNPKKVTSRTGHEGGHHASVRIESDFQGYIDKDVEVAWMDVYFPDADPTALNS